MQDILVMNRSIKAYHVLQFTTFSNLAKIFLRGALNSSCKIYRFCDITSCFVTLVYLLFTVLEYAFRANQCFS